MNSSQQDALHITVKLEGGQEIIALEFTGHMALSTLYEFQIDVLSKDWIDGDTIFNKKVQLLWTMGELTRQLSGLIDHWQVVDNNLGLDQYFRYRFHLVPMVSLLQHTTNIATYLNKSVPDIISQILQQNHIEFRLDLHQNYPNLPFVCQYQESDWHFICRWFERLGMFFYFDHQQQKETLVITDANGTLQADNLLPQLIYQPVPKQPLTKNQARLWSWSCHKKRCPQKVHVVAYDPNKASQVISADATVDAKSQGTVTFWQETLLSEAEVKAYAQTLATVYQCQAEVFHGRIDLGISPGVFVSVDDTYHAAWNQKNYLIVQADYHASQQQAVLANVSQVTQADQANSISECLFTAIPLSQAFCAAINTPMPKISGVIPAFIIDSTNSGIEIPINQDGCYQVAFSGEAAAKTFWLRMVQPYANDQSGFAVPLHANTEVLLSFLYGNPDLPIIVGAVYNSTHKNIVGQGNKTQSGIVSCNKSSIMFEDTPSKNSITLSTPNGTAKITISD